MRLFAFFHDNFAFAEAATRARGGKTLKRTLVQAIKKGHAL